MSMTISLSSDAPRCPGTTTTVTASPSGLMNYEFFIDANSNGTLDIGEVVQNGSSDTYSSTSFVNGDVLGVVVTDGNGCEATQTTIISVLPPDYTFAGSGGLTGVVTDNFDYETDGAIESIQQIQPSAIVDYDSGTEVIMLPGFEVILGGQLEAFIDGCDNGNGGKL